MCGIVGISTFSSNLLERIKAATLTLYHRGPDDQGVWVCPKSDVAFGHRRLSIVDVSAGGHQPMVSKSGRYTIAFNGEIYNYIDLKVLLEKDHKSITWVGNSDTEVLLMAIDSWGLNAVLEKITGMFAFALYDQLRETIHLVRDRMGEKPIYYGVFNNEFIFASELKALKALSGPLDIDRDALAEYMMFGYVPAPKSIYQNIKKLSAACFISYDIKTKELGAQKEYWNLHNKELRNLPNIHGEEKSQLDSLEKVLVQAVSEQMVADVPLGAFLSGGVDSSLITALMQSQSSMPVRTFTIGFEEAEFDESQYAAAVARHIGTNHTELKVTAADAESVIPDLPDIYDEPFADTSQIPTFLVSRLTRQYVKVALSGDGGDEVFCGYSRYQITSKLWNKKSRLPNSICKALSSSISLLAPNTWDALFSPLPSNLRTTINGRRLHQVSKMGAASSLQEMYIRLMSRWQEDDNLVKGGKVNLHQFMVNDQTLKGENSLRLWDLKYYLPDDILTKVDRASMSVGLETRAPFLNHKVVEMALQLPRSLLISDGVGKWALRTILDKYVPRRLIERPKAGFEIPLAKWLRGPLKEWAEALLDHSKLKQEGFLNADLVSKYWSQHQSGKWDRGMYLWNVLMFEAWLKKQ